jgi:hypothetical protein
MIYRHPSGSKPRFVFGVVVAGTGALLGAGIACGSRVLPSSSAPNDDDAADDGMMQGVSGTSAGGGISGFSPGGGVSGFSVGAAGVTDSGQAISGTSASGGTALMGSSASSGSGGCTSGSSGSCNLILYDAANDAVENLDTGPDQAAALDASGDGTTEAGEQ